MAVNFGVRNYTAPDTIRGSQAHNNRFNLRELGEITGGELGKRDRDIAYNRALGLVDDRTTLGEGVGQAWDWTKDMAQSGLDLVKPVAQELKDSSAELVKPLVDWAEPKLDSLNSELEYQIDPFHATDKRAEKYADEQGKKVWEDVGLPEPKTESEPVNSYEVGESLPMPVELASENVVQGEPTPPMTVETPKVDVAQTVAADTSVASPKGKDWGKLFQIDPARAKFEWEQEYQQKKMDADLGKEQSPESVRFKIASGLNAVNAALAKMDSTDPNYDATQIIRKKLEAELSVDNPSLQNAYAAATAEINGEPAPTPAPGPTPTPTPTETTENFSDRVTASKYIVDTLASIQWKKDAEVSGRKLLTEISNSSLPQGDKTALAEEVKRGIEGKKNPVPAADVDKAVDALFEGSSTEPVPAAYNRYDKSFNAYNAAKSAYNADAIGASIGNFLFSLRPEAVNVSDIELAQNSVRSGDQQTMKGLLDKVGLGSMVTTDYRKLAEQLGRAAYDKLVEDRATNSKQITQLLGKLDPKKVEARALVYYKAPGAIGPKAPAGGNTKKDPLGIR